MTYIENIFLCLALPLILSMFFIKGRVRRYALFLTVGMAVCLLSAYVSSFFMGQYGVDGTVAAIEITPEVNSVSTVSTSPEKRAAIAPGSCSASAAAGSRVSFVDISERSAWVIFCPTISRSVSCAEESAPSDRKSVV